jgi:23S rRNA (cytosine1962-C5)-methyltransferase
MEPKPESILERHEEVRMKSIHLKSGRERAVIRNHPWIFAGAIAEVRGDPEMGETVEVYSHDGTWLAYAAFSPHSQIRARIWTWDPDEEVNADFFTHRIQHSIQVREQLYRDEKTTAVREIFAESDGLPGLIVDRYGELRVIQILFAGMERWREAIVNTLIDNGDCRTIYERSDVDIRQLEGLPLRSERLWGEDLENLQSIVENDISYYVDITQGHKTGFYLDQRENRQALREMIPDGVSVVDCFSYSGGFSINALKAGAGEIIAIDSSAIALDLVAKNISLNGLDPERVKLVEGDVFKELRKFRDQNLSFDVIVLDPPKFASTPAHVQRAARGYKDINILAFKLLKPGGMLFTFSCSGGVGVDLFQKIVADAALDAGRKASVIRWLGQAMDHPVLLSFPEGRYLKGLVCRVEGRW